MAKPLLLLLSMLFPLVAASETLKLLSYNVWFDRATANQRFPAIIRYLEISDYDVIALQECTADFIQRLKQSRALQDYHLIQGKLIHGYTNVTLVKPSVEYQTILKIPTNMGRTIPVVQLTKPALWVANVHLESEFTDNALRKMQIETLLPHVPKIVPAVIMGDTNMYPNSEEEDLLLKADWQDLASDNQEPTYDLMDNTSPTKTRYARLDLPFSDHWPISARLGFLEISRGPSGSHHYWPDPPRYRSF